MVITVVCSIIHNNSLSIITYVRDTMYMIKIIISICIYVTICCWHTLNVLTNKRTMQHPCKLKVVGLSFLVKIYLACTNSYLYVHAIICPYLFCWHVFCFVSNVRQLCHAIYSIYIYVTIGCWRTLNLLTNKRTMQHTYVLE